MGRVQPWFLLCLYRYGIRVEGQWWACQLHYGQQKHQWVHHSIWASTPKSRMGSYLEGISIPIQIWPRPLHPFEDAAERANACWNLGSWEEIQCQLAPSYHVLFKGKDVFFNFFDIFFGLKPIKKQWFTLFSHFFSHSVSFFWAFFRGHIEWFICTSIYNGQK
jgi:hypothetical protein